MNQQINLYQPILRRERVMFSATAMVQSVAVLLVVLILFTVYIQMRASDQEKELASLSVQRDQLSAQLTDASRRLPPGTEDPVLVERVNQRVAELSGKRAFLEQFKNQEMGNTAGFSGHLAGLARQPQDGLWLQAVTVEGSGNMVLAGYVLDAESLPAWLQKLSGESAFAGTQFQVLRMNREEENPGRLAFELRTRPGEEVQ